MYFDTSSAKAAHVIEHADDPGRFGMYFHLTHVVLVAGIIVSAVADELVIGHGAHHVELKYLAVLLGGPAIYLLGNGLFKRVAFGRFPLSHLGGLTALALLTQLASQATVGTIGMATTVVMLLVAGWEAVSRRRGGLVVHRP
jgi:low temperature requirement protein LtrA